MLVVMQCRATELDIARVVEVIRSQDYRRTSCRGQPELRLE